MERTNGSLTRITNQDQMKVDLALSVKMPQPGLITGTELLADIVRSRTVAEGNCKLDRIFKTP
jgi:hypothetical protein